MLFYVIKKRKKEATQLGFSSKDLLFLSWFCTSFLHLTTESISFRLFFAFRLHCCQKEFFSSSYKFSVTFVFFSLAPYWLNSPLLVFHPDTSALCWIPGIASLFLWPLYPFPSQFNQYIQLNTEVDGKVSWPKLEGLNTSYINCIPITYFCPERECVFLIEMKFRLQKWLIFFWNSQALLLQIYFFITTFKKPNFFNLWKFSLGHI